MAAFAAGPVLAGVLSIAVIPLMAYRLPPADIGHYYLLQTIAALGSAALTLGLDQAYVREFHDSQRPALTWLSAAWLPTSLVLVLAVPLALLSGDVADLLLGVARSSYGWTIIACLVLSVSVRFLQVRLRMEHHAVVFSLGNLLPKLCVAVFLLADIAFVGSTSASYLAVAGAHIVGLALAGVMAVAVGAARVPRGSPLGVRGETGQLLNYGYPLAIAALVNWLLLSAPAWFVRALADADQLALLSITLGIAGIATLVQAVFGTIWAPLAYSWFSEGEAAVARMREVGRFVAVAVMLVLCGSAFVGPSVASVLPNQYAESGPLLGAAVLPGLLATLAEVSGIGVQVARRSWWALMATVSAALVSGVLCVVLVERWGARGATVALGASFLALLWLRTAASVRLWFATVPAGYMAGVTLLSALALAQAWLGDSGQAWWPGVWAAALVLVIVFFRKDLAHARQTISEWRGSPSS